ncbi:hypothetical protein BGW36DRAFT_433303 [Talaromyces proteolyticus]|uniref:Uncharacterized protein n=1 Tax=Talaromyces proteolyticus TaxID=1131652 RepID=A0AAD4PTT9_9EURO|nr:uncharacterized protein BGW36DRAFT_433303 [Talaromyces proteolyticus]KAH8689296.1 hypothetical protein BGW36DRAFT_433303 [Talaromyces proteolyticus]
MNETRLEKLARQKSELDAAWAEHDRKQAALEAEIRRPAKHIDVMSNDEWNRIRKAQDLYQVFYEKYYEDAARFSKFLRGMIAQFIEENKLQSQGDGMERDIDRVSAELSDALMVYYLIATDMHFSGKVNMRSEWKWVLLEAGIKGFERPVIREPTCSISLDYGSRPVDLLRSIMMSRIQSENAVVSDDQVFKTNEALSDKKLARQFILDTMQEKLKEDILTASQKTILSGIINEEVVKSTFEVLVTQAMGINMPWGSTVGKITTRMFFLIPENSGPIPDVMPIYKDVCKSKLDRLTEMMKGVNLPNDARGFDDSCLLEI